ncbi:hypothetical protein JCGZ_19134 [Jatropha curcas]|uniref:Uncharacterized protein n=1 Tax=Jatropha curcas TaxID=180498 RepID=A0A067K0D6_JATCU|nr:hypothetical protein JCGZ_19134 [Jatropha curcas]
MLSAYAIFVRTQLLVHVPPPTEFDSFTEMEELDRGQGDAPTQVFIANYNEVCQLYKAALLKLALVRLSDEHVSRISMVPPAGHGRGIQCGRHAGHGAGRRLIIVEETEESGSDDSEETGLNLS